MKRWRYMLIAALLVMPGAVDAQEETAPLVSITNPMVADISTSTIEIHASFNGTQLLVFGARNMSGDLVIALRGPTAKVKLRRKERIAGMWMHVAQRNYYGLPVFYAMAATKPLETIASAEVRQSLGLGTQEVITASSPQADDAFDPALTRILRAKRWWQEPAATILYFGESLFKARMDLPSSLPPGDYTAEVYLFDRGTLQGFQAIPLRVYKTGIDARIYDLAQKNGWFYGLLAVLMALSGGWLAHRLFHRA